MRLFLRPLLGLVSAYAGLALPLHSQAAPPPNPVPSLAEDPVLQRLLREALEHNPELARSRVQAKAEGERVSQAAALPDPSLGVGIQNDGFRRLEVGHMETSYYSITATQPLPWPGKRGLRKEIADLERRGAEASLQRSRLELEAGIKRAYLALLLARGQKQLLEAQELFLQQAQELARTRYEVGQGTQADLLRAQVERTRLAQTKLSLEAEEHQALASLNHLRLRDPGEIVESGTRLEALADPQLQSLQAWETKARAESPELQAAGLGKTQAERNLDLARLERRPDFAVSAGLMPRGSLDPMWSLGVSITVPLWSRSKQQRAVAEQEWRLKAGSSQIQSVQHLLSQRIQERNAQMGAALESLKLYREALLVQSEASFKAALAQYEAGRMPFLSVLEALRGWIADRSGFLQTQTQAQSLQIALEEMSLGPTNGSGATMLSAGSMSLGGGPTYGGTSRKPSATESSDSGPASSMGSM